MLASWDIAIVCPERLQRQVRSLVAPPVQVRACPDRYFGSVKNYNRLMLSRAFYGAFEDYEYMLIVQLDALVISDQLAAWCQKGHSYVGAPWFRGYARPKRPLEFAGVGNGGFSLRRIPDFVHVLRRVRWLGPLPGGYVEKSALGWVLDAVSFGFNRPPFSPRVNEDLFWGALVPARVSQFRVPAPHEAIRFAFEAEPRHLYALTDGELPFGCHAWEKHDRSFWIERLTSIDGSSALE